MQSRYTRLDRFLSVRTGIHRRDVRLVLAQGRVSVDGCIATDIQQIIGEFSHVTLDHQIIQDNIPRYIMMNKPAGVVSATKDQHHQTVIDLLNCVDADNLHIVGRLDFNSTGLLLLTNDGRWSRNLTLPEKKVSKRYRVTLQYPITQAYVRAFAEGMYFSYENITTRAAKLYIINEYVAEVRLVEGRYHQIKRMFGRFNNPVLALHRIAVGNLMLDVTLLPGQSRSLTASELQVIAIHQDDE